MKILCTNTARGLVPIYDEDFDEKKKLKIGKDYVCDIKLARNVRFLNKYMAFMKVSFSCLPAKVQEEYFGDDWRNWRNELELVAGSYDVVFSFETKKMEHRHRSVAFHNMDEAEFSDLYDKVKNYAWSIIGKYVSQEQFEKLLQNF